MNSFKAKEEGKKENKKKESTRRKGEEKGKKVDHRRSRNLPLARHVNCASGRIENN